MEEGWVPEVSTVKKQPQIVQLIDLQGYHSNQDGSLERNHKKVDRGEQCYFALPGDMPAYLRATRLLEREEKTGKPDHTYSLQGWTIELDYFTFGVKVYVRLGFRDGTLKVFAEDSEGMVKLEEWQR